MAEYTTITVSKSLKADLAAEMREGETWNEYLRRLKEAGGEPSSRVRGSGSALSEEKEEVERFRTVARQVIEAEADCESRADRTEPGEIDYDHLREIVREEVRRALEDVVR